MGWAFCGTDDLGREIGYGVEATCDQPRCEQKIDRGLAYCCGGMHLGGDYGCGRCFCPAHLLLVKRRGQLCEGCAEQTTEG